MRGREGEGEREKDHHLRTFMPYNLRAPFCSCFFPWGAVRCGRLLAPPRVRESRMWAQQQLSRI